MEQEFETSHTDEVVCPYCSHEQGDSWEYNNNGNEQKVWCGECSEQFTLICEYEVNYSTFKKEQENAK